MSELFKTNYQGVDPQTYITAFNQLLELARDDAKKDEFFNKCKIEYNSLRPFEETIYGDRAERSVKNGTTQAVSLYNEEEEKSILCMFLICELYHNIYDDPEDRQMSREELLHACCVWATDTLIAERGYVRQYLERFVERCFHEYDLDKFEQEADKEKWARLLTYMLEYCERPEIKDTPVGFLAYEFNQSKDIIVGRSADSFSKIVETIFQDIPDSELEEEVLRYFSMKMAIELVHRRVRPDILQESPDDNALQDSKGAQSDKWEVSDKIFQTPLSNSNDHYLGDVNLKFQKPKGIQSLIEYFVSKSWIDNDFETKQYVLHILTGRLLPEPCKPEKQIWRGKLNELIFTCKFLYTRQQSGTVPKGIYEKAITLFNFQPKAKNKSLSAYATSERADANYREFLNKTFI